VSITVCLDSVFSFAITLLFLHSVIHFSPVVAASPKVFPTFLPPVNNVLTLMLVSLGGTFFTAISYRSSTYEFFCMLFNVKFSICFTEMLFFKG